MSAADAKRRLRAELLGRRRALTPDVLAVAAARLGGHLLAGLDERAVSSVAAYLPVGSEPGGPDLAAALDAVGLVVLLPVLRPDHDLDWARYTGPDALITGSHGIGEPTGERLGVEAVGHVDVVVVPALAVDRTGVRLGRGGGCYDRVLARLPAGMPVVALLHDGELVERLPAEPHDRSVGWVITPAAGWLRL
ncbi:MAG TPA: 5-formyltetrahydrofolate cyclo-ligase [Cryptosporangiaceae bacterium]|nr:5-formyltetrahydrofolate cyclo-ligase [Cryptosporangiaceae bacterium]